jgi:hypothetical protein
MTETEGMRNGIDFYFYSDRINQSSLKLRPGKQDYQEIIRLRRGGFRPKAALSERSC